MITETEMRGRLSDAWRIAAERLSIKIEAPYVLNNDDGAEIPCIAYLPDFGCSSGMVVGFVCRPSYEIDTDLQLAAKSKGFFYSFINFEIYEHYREETFKEALNDWGFFGNETLKPNWMDKPKEVKQCT